jgi:hypothetical protein
MSRTQSGPDSDRSPRSRGWLIVGIVALLVLGAGTGVIILLTRPPPPPPDWLDNPPADNAFDDYVRAGELIYARGQPHAAFVEAGFDPAERTEVVKANRDVLDIVREAAGKEGAVVPLPPRTLDDRPGKIRSLVRFVSVAAVERDDAGQHDEALVIATDGMAMSVGCARGPLVWTLSAIGYEGIAGKALHRVSDHASPQALRETASRLQEMDTAWPDFAETRAADDQWTRERGLSSPVRDVLQTVQVDPKVRTTLRRNCARRRVLAAKLAVLAHKGERATLPPDLQALAPEYLDSVPEDPFASGPLRYRKTATGFVVYSVGEDKKDDAGTPLSYGSDKRPLPGDVCAGFPAAQYGF